MDNTPNEAPSNKPTTSLPGSSASNSPTMMILAVVAAVLLAFPAGYVVGMQLADDDATETSTTSNDTEDDSHAHTDDAAMEEYSHEMYEVPAGVDVPAVELGIEADAKSGWNVHLDLTNFTLTPENVNGEHVEGEGHAHIYVDGKKLGRLYAADYYLDGLSEGEHEIKVTLNTNDHKDYAADGTVISDSAMITDMHHATDGHSH